jgi:hypothetical protein
MAKKKKKQKTTQFPNLGSVIGKFFSANFKYFIAAIFIYFAAKSLYFIFTIPLGVAPDEVEHFELVKFYQSNINFWEPFKDIPLPYGRTATNNGFIYHLLMGKLSLLNFFISDLVFLRTVNLVMAILNVFVFYKLCSLFTNKKIVKLWLMVFYTNILMFTFISSAVNYDNLVNLISVSSIYFFIRYTIDRLSIDLICTLLFISLGIAVKTGYWPLAIVLVGILVLDFLISRYSLKNLLLDFYINFKSRNYLFYIVGILTILFVIFDVIFVSGKFKKYGNYDASCEQLYSLESCRANDDGYIIYENLSDKFEEKKSKNVEITKSLHSLPEFSVEWYGYIIDRVFGIFGHRQIEPSTNTVSFINSLFLVAIFASIFNYKYLDKKKFYIFFIAIAFTLLILVRVNYQSYLNYGLVHAGLQGRYLFPVLSCLVLWLGISISGDTKSSLAKFIIVILCLGLIISEFPMYLQSTQRNDFEAPK